MGEYEITSARNPNRPSSIPITVKHSKTNVPNRVPRQTVEKIFNHVEMFIQTMGETVTHVSSDHVGNVTQVHIDISTTPTAIALLTSLYDTYLSSRLKGLSLPSTSHVRVTWAVSAFPKRTRDVYTQYSKRHVMIQRHAPTTIIPFYFAGFMDMSYMYVTCTGIPPETRIGGVLPPSVFSTTNNKQKKSTCRVDPDAWTKLYTLVIQVLRTGFWIPGPLDRLGVVITSQGKAQPVIRHTMSLLEIPRSIVTDLINRLDRGESLPQIVHASALMPWVRQRMRHTNETYPKTTFMDTLLNLATISTPQTKTMTRFLRDATSMPTTPISRTPILQKTSQSLNRRSVDSIMRSMGIPEENVSNIAKGQYGTTYRIGLTKNTIERMVQFTKQMSHVTVHTYPVYQKGYAVLKIEKLRQRNAKHLGNVTREARIHLKVSSSSVLGPKRGLFGTQREFKGSDIAPVLYFSGVYGGHVITCMEYIPGVPLQQYIANGTLTDTIVRRLERAVETLIRIGVVHGDLHANNIMVTSNERVVIIDYGFAFEIPPRVHDAVLKILNSTKSIERAWIESGLQSVVNARFESIPYYHSNLKMLQKAKALLQP